MEIKMKKLLSIFCAALMLSIALPSVPTFAADEVVYQENAIDKMSDWAATVGKDKDERDRILLERKAERQRKHLEKKAASMQKRTEKKAANLQKQTEKKAGAFKRDANAAGKDAKKKLGL
jgi:hypothetical protein